MFFIAVDTHSKWPEVQVLPNNTVQRTLDSLCQMFAAYGLPSQIVSDNGPQFVLQEFASFMKSHGIRHVRSTLYQPASNGLINILDCHGLSYDPNKLWDYLGHPNKSHG